MTNARGPLTEPSPWDMVASAYAAELTPEFEKFAADALALVDAAALEHGARIVDVAAGPGTLSFLAARRGASVAAVDFAPGMIARLRERAAREGVAAIDARVADGCALPFPDATFDAAFSMFGLMFFPDRARGFAELLRVLRAGAQAVVSSWVPMTRVPVLLDLFTALRAHLPALPLGGASAPLASAEDFTAEMRAAGFRDVAVTEVTHVLEAPTLASMWESMLRTNAPLVLVRRGMGEEAWGPVGRGIYEALRAKHGEGAQRVAMIANLGIGRK